MPWDALLCSPYLSVSPSPSLALPLGTELPPGHASAPKLMTIEPKACTSKSNRKTRS